MCVRSGIVKAHDHIVVVSSTETMLPQQCSPCPMLGLQIFTDRGDPPIWKFKYRSSSEFLQYSERHSKPARETLRKEEGKMCRAERDTSSNASPTLISIFISELMDRDVLLTWCLAFVQVQKVHDAFMIKMVSVDPKGEGIASIRPQSLIDMMKVSRTLLVTSARLLMPGPSVSSRSCLFNICSDSTASLPCTKQGSGSASFQLLYPSCPPLQMLRMHRPKRSKQGTPVSYIDSLRVNSLVDSSTIISP